MRSANPILSPVLCGAVALLLFAVSSAAAVPNRDIAISGATLRLDSAGRVHVVLACAPDARRPRCRGLLRIVARGEGSGATSWERAGTTSRAARGRTRS